MARVKKGVNAHKRHKKILKLAKGFYGQKSKVFRAANPAVMRSLRSAYAGRKQKKREYRRMWIARINAGARGERHILQQADERAQGFGHRNQQENAC
jgi:large subunit ribosomal protein L20